MIAGYKDITSYIQWYSLRRQERYQTWGLNLDNNTPGLILKCHPGEIGPQPASGKLSFKKKEGSYPTTSRQQTPDNLKPVTRAWQMCMTVEGRGANVPLAQKNAGRGGERRRQQHTSGRWTSFSVTCLLDALPHKTTKGRTMMHADMQLKQFEINRRVPTVTQNFVQVEYD